MDHCENQVPGVQRGFRGKERGQGGQLMYKLSQSTQTGRRIDK